MQRLERRVVQARNEYILELAATNEQYLRFRNDQLPEVMVSETEASACWRQSLSIPCARVARAARTRVSPLHLFFVRAGHRILRQGRHVTAQSPLVSAALCTMTPSPLMPLAPSVPLTRWALLSISCHFDNV